MKDRHRVVAALWLMLAGLAWQLGFLPFEPASGGGLDAAVPLVGMALLVSVVAL